MLKKLNRNLEMFADYTIKDVIGSGSNATVYRAEQNGKHFALKIGEIPGDSEGDKLRFRREVAALARLKHPGLVKVYDAGIIDESTYLVTDIANGRSLRNLLSEIGAFDEQTLINIAKSISGPLSEIHQQGLVHRDLKPDNVLIGDDGDVTIIDLGYVTNAGIYVQKENEIVGTVLYSSPEQLGLVSVPLGPESDLYSLGVMLYECAAGRPPFFSEDLSELVQMHLTETVRPLSQISNQFSSLFSNIVEKLMAKDQEKRYATALQMVTDLEAFDEIQRQGEPYALARRETRKRPNVSGLVGREEEVQKLNNVLSLAQASSGSIAIVSGESGLGKTRLCQEILFHGTTNELVIVSKCEEFNIDPFVCIQALVDQLGIDETLTRSAAGQSADQIKKIFPRLAKVLNIKSSSKPTSVSQSELYELATEFLVSLLKGVNKSIVWLLDDLQWMDEGSFEVACRLASHLSSMKLMILCTSRNDEVHLEIINAFRNRIQLALKCEIDLKPLTYDGVAKLICLQLGQTTIDGTLVENIRGVTNGNAYLVKEYIRSLVEVGVLSLKRGLWTLDKDQLAKAPLPSDAANLIRNRLNLLSASVLRVAQCASVIGMEFSLAGLQSVSELNEVHIRSALADCMQDGLIEPSPGGHYRFIHDRVREALYQSSNQTERTEIHQRTAEFLSSVYFDDESKVFEIAHHYQRGYWQRSSEMAFRFNLKAGLKASEVQSNSQAQQFLEAALEVSEHAKGSFPLGELFSTLGQIALRQGQLPEAITNFKMSLNYIHEPLQTAKIHVQILEAYVANINVGGVNERLLAWEEANLALGLLGYPIPKNETLMLLTVAAQWSYSLILSALKIGFGRSKGETSERLRISAQVYLLGMRLAYFSGRENLMLYCALRIFVAGYAIGVKRETASAFSTYAIVMAVLKIKDYARKMGAKAIAMAEELKSPSLIASVSIEVGHVLHFCGLAFEAEEHFNKTLKKYDKWATLEYLNAASNELSAHYLFRGLPRQVLLMSETAIEKSRNNKTLPPLQPRVFCMTAYAQLGETKAAASIHKEVIELINRTERDPFTASTISILFLSYALDTAGKNTAQIDTVISDFYAFGFTPKTAPWHTRLGYCLVAYLRLRQFEALPHDPVVENNIVSALKDSATGSVAPVSKCHHFVVSAAYFRVKGKLKKALRELKKAEKLAAVCGSFWANAEIHRERARLQTTENERKYEALIAHSFALSGQMMRLADEIRIEFAISPGVRGRSEGLSESVAARSMNQVFAKRYADSLIRVSLASASTIDPKIQAQVSLDEIIKALSAERAFVFLHDELSDKLVVQAGRNDRGEDLAILNGFSTAVVEKVRMTRQPLIVDNTGQNSQLSSESIVIQDLRSILAAPLELRGKFMGVVYADSRITNGLFSKDDLELFTGIANHVAIAFESAKLANSEAERLAMQKDLEISASVQQLFLPKGESVAIANGIMAGFYRSATQCGGDWWWYRRVGNKLQILVGDVTGHGAGPAMITAFVASLTRAYTNQNEAVELPQLVTSLNKDLVDLAKGSYWMTLLAAEVDFQNQTLDAWSAGSPGLLIFNEKNEYTLFCETSTPLGSDGKFELAHQSCKLNKRDRIVVFTDGLVEVTVNGKPFGLRKFVSTLKQVRNLSPVDANLELVNNIDQLRGQELQEDDFTMVTLDIN